VEDFQALGVDLRWNPREIFGPGYFLWPDTSTGSDCGTVDHLRPLGGLGEDSTFTWSIHFAPGSRRSCVAYQVWGDHEPTQPASFCLASVQVMDSQGVIRELEITGGATVLGGVSEGCPLAVNAVSPTMIRSGSEAVVFISGAGFDGGARVVLAAGEADIPATLTTVLSSNRISASFAVPERAAGVADLIVTTGVGEVDTLSAGIWLEAVPPPYQPRSVVVRFRPGVVSLPAPQTAAVPSSARFRSPAQADLLSAIGVTSIRYVSPDIARLAESDPGSVDHGLLDLFVLELADTSVISACFLLRADSTSVVDANPDWRGVLCSTQSNEMIPTDNRFGRQWWLRNSGPTTYVPGGVATMDCRATGAWYVYTGNSPVTVVVIDTGFNSAHLDLAGVRGGPSFPDAFAPPRTRPPSPTEDVNGHGSAICGIVGARGNNWTAEQLGGVAGVNWGADVLSLKVGDASGEFFSSDVQAAIGYLLTLPLSSRRVVVLAHAFYPPGGEFEIDEAYIRALWRTGSFIVAPAGNEVNGIHPSWPGLQSKYVYTVGSFDQTGNRWAQSAFGPHIDAMAPGGAYIETTNRGPYNAYWMNNPGDVGFTGTSAAAAVAGGSASLLYSYLNEIGCEDFSSEDVEAILNSTATDMLFPGWDQETGWGRLNLAGAFDAVPARVMVERGEAPAYSYGGAGTIPSILVDQGDINQYNDVARHIVYARVVFPTPFIVPPRLWLRQRESVGYGVSLPGIIEPGPLDSWCAVDTVTATYAAFHTYVYLFPQQGGHPELNLPCAWDEAYVAYTAVGPRTSAGVAPSGRVIRRPSLQLEPTPASRAVRLRVSLPEAGDAALEVFDVKGARRAVPRRGRWERGQSVVEWDLSCTDGMRVEPGLYFVRLTAGAVSATARLVVLE
jgi:hypothetical protein